MNIETFQSITLKELIDKRVVYRRQKNNTKQTLHIHSHLGRG